MNKEVEAERPKNSRAVCDLGLEVPENGNSLSVVLQTDPDGGLFASHIVVKNAILLPCVGTNPINES